MIQKVKFLILIFSVCVFQLVISQDQGKYYDMVSIAVPTSGVTSNGSLNFNKPCSNFNVKEGKVWIKVDLGSQYQLGSTSAGTPFDIDVNLDLSLVTTSTSPKINFNLSLNNDKPESILYFDLNQFIDATNTTTGISYLTESITGASVSVNSAIDNSNSVNIQNDLKISLHYEIVYGVDVSSHQLTNLTHVKNADNKVVKFSWENTCSAPNYEFQLLRLFNKNALTATDERQITTDVDWSKALTFQTYSADTEIDITIGEGQGFYVWRVRPIGTFNTNNIGNNKNWGTWNNPDYVSLNGSFTDTSLTSDTFFFEDADDDKNYQYSRVFTEGNKISEQVTYATTLNQIKQTQRYFPSKNYKIISQTVLDKSGRPTLTTLPVPVEGKKIDKYQTNFVVTNGELYRAKHFDEDTNYKEPSKVDVVDINNVTTAFQYYSSMNGDARIPSAEGYPYTRVLFSNDGTDRVIEKSGVGQTHMIGDQALGQGRTVRTLYGTPTEEELVALFGDEAPAPENTSKVTTIDPNNTKSVAYITKDGNTIATGLTFSEDDAILDNIETGPRISGKIDKITNNIRTSEGFKSAKRITILEDATEINLSYTIAKPVIEGLCSNLEIDLDYKLVIEVFNVESNTVYNNYSFEVESIKESATTATANDVTIDFGNISLDVGTYYIQKTLVPADKVNAQLVDSRENIERLIAPYFNWMVSALDEIDCEEEMQALYNDIFLFGKKVYEGENGQEGLAGNGGVLNFDDTNQCEDCSGVSITFPQKDTNNPDAPDEFLDYYSVNKESYKILIYYFEAGELKTIDFATQTSIGAIKIAAVKFVTPCCEFEVPVAFTPPFRKPSAEALAAYKSDTAADTKLNNSKNYYDDTDANKIYPNFYYLSEKAANFSYTQAQDGSVTLENTDAYPIDFEGYAVSMLYQCKNSADPSYDIDKAKIDFYKAMRGWHEPGLFNQMVYHMATDNHGANGCKNLVDGSGGIDAGNSGNTSTNTPPIDKYHICDVPEEPVYLNGAQYSIKELAECWEAIVIEMVNEICVEGLKADIDQSSNVANNVDQQGTDGNSITNDHLKENIRNFIVRWISKRKLRRKVRRRNVGTTDSIEDEVKKISGNLVKDFLDCTGYAFADIIETPNSPQTNFSDLDADFNTITDDGEYDRIRLLDTSTNEGEDWGYFKLSAPKDPQDPDYNSDIDKEYFNPIDYDTASVKPATILKDLFPRIQDPVYAYKYYVYQDEFPDLEVQTCYRDPNICKDANGNDVPCCGGTLAEPTPCNFCGIGYITCPYTKKDWSCDQRYTFYNMIKNYEEVPEESAVVLECSNFYEGTDYVINPFVDMFLPDSEPGADNSGASIEDDFNFEFKQPYDTMLEKDAFFGIPYLSRELVEQYIDTYKGDVNAFERLKSEGGDVALNDINGNEQTSGVSIIENDAFAMKMECTENCDQRREEFKEDLIKAFTDRCYIIGECKIDTNDNIIPIADIEAMVDKIVEQCKNQCAITTYSCNDEPCRSPKTSVYQFGTSPVESSTHNTSYIDYGVSGPILNGISTRNQNLLIVNADGSVSDTGIQPDNPTANNISQTGILEKYNFTYSNTVSIWDMRRSLTYAEYARWVQAMEWEIDVNIPSKCDIEGYYNPTLTYNVCGIPTGTVYVFNENEDKWEPQDLSMFECANPEDLKYVSRQNPDGNQDTFIDRDQYIKDKSVPVSTSDSEFTNSVKSRKMDIKVTIKGQ